MPNSLCYSAQDILRVTGGQLVMPKGKEIQISQVMPFQKAKPDSITLFDDLNYKHFLQSIKPSLIIVKEGLEGLIENIPYIKHPEPRSIMPQLLALFEKKPIFSGISDSAHISRTSRIGDDTSVGHFAVVSNGAVIGENCHIGAHVYIGDNVTLGKNAVINPGVKIHYNCIIGSNVIIHSNSVLGSDGYGYWTNKTGEHIKIPQIGRVVVHDDVEIGSCVTIDRGTMGDTVIGSGTKIDNLVQIAHNVNIGRNCLIVAQVGISGSVIIGDFVVIAGQTGIADHISIPSFTKIGGKSVVINSIKKSGDYSGNPLLPLNDFLRNSFVYRKLYKVYKDVRSIKKTLKIPDE